MVWYMVWSASYNHQGKWHGGVRRVVVVLLLLLLLREVLFSVHVQFTSCCGHGVCSDGRGR